MSDFDFDLSATTNNVSILKGVYSQDLPVTYKKKSASKVDIVPIDLYNADVSAFGSQIGSITNKSTSMYAMLPLYDSSSKQYKEIERRLIMTRVAQGNEIDRAKGILTKKFPKHWSNYQHINENDSSDVKSKKELFNSILIEKRPYFFRYLYRESNKAYNKFICEEEAYRAIYGIEYVFDKPKDQLTEREEYYIRSYDYRNPLIDSDCEMNRLCHYIEGVNFDVRAFSHGGKGDIYGEYVNYSIEWDEAKYRTVLSEVKRFFKAVSENVSMSDHNGVNKYLAEEESKLQNKIDLFKDKMFNVCSNVDELTNYLVKAFYVGCTSLSKDVLWKSFGKVIFQNVLAKHKDKIKIPILDSEGENDYLFDKYSVVEVNTVG